MDKSKIMEEYSANDMRKLKQLSYSIFVKFGGIYQKDNDEFYSKANEELWKATETYDDTTGVPFDKYLKMCLQRKFKTQMTDMNRIKRKADRDALSIETPIVGKDGSTSTVEDTLKSEFNIENEISEEIGILKDERVELYLNTLSKVQQKIVLLLVDGYLQDEIIELLHISKKEYVDNLIGIRAYENVKILY